jgi:hypothetical protein
LSHSEASLLVDVVLEAWLGEEGVGLVGGVEFFLVLGDEVVVAVGLGGVLVVLGVKLALEGNLVVASLGDVGLSLSEFLYEIKCRNVPWVLVSSAFLRSTCLWKSANSEFNCTTLSLKAAWAAFSSVVNWLTAATSSFLKLLKAVTI